MLFNPLAGQDRTEDVEVFFDFHPVPLEVFPVVAFGHMQIMVHAGPRGKGGGGNAPDSLCCAVALLVYNR
ncbi:hypothetical protein D3C75_784780 [compost metagenome]